MTIGEADRCRDAQVGFCCAIGVMVGLVQRGGLGWLGTSWVREKASREKEKESREQAGVARGGSRWLGWLGTVRKRAEIVRKRESRD